MGGGVLWGLLAAAQRALADDAAGARKGARSRLDLAHDDQAAPFVQARHLQRLHADQLPAQLGDGIAAGGQLGINLRHGALVGENPTADARQGQQVLE